ncbi:MAG: hypothetical protein QE271_11015 [Bacteriovoracaceae bacterium]|nr:hypothetical protein [Bacteriovoracaceae bacterium]
MTENIILFAIATCMPFFVIGLSKKILFQRSKIKANYINNVIDLKLGTATVNKLKRNL